MNTNPLGGKMKINGKCVTGDPVLIDRYTSDWMSIRIHPNTFYRRMDVFQKGLDKTRGYHAEIDVGPFVYVRFTEKEDLTEFHRMHHEYL